MASAEWLKMSKKRDKMLNIYKKTNKIRDQKYYKKLKYICKKIFIHDKYTYFSLMLDKASNNNKLMWKTLNTFTGNTNTNPMHPYKIKVGDDINTNLLEICNVFNDFFVNIIDEIKVSFNVVSPTLNIVEDNAFTFSFDKITELQIMKAFTVKRSSNMETYNSVPYSIIDALKDTFIHFLMGQYNNMVENCIFPDCLKISKIIPIHKNGSKVDVKNYRPISILPYLSKIFERILADNILSHLMANKLLSNHQFGFRKGHSTEMAFNMLIIYIVNLIQKNYIVSVVFLDYSKAFDSINFNNYKTSLVFPFQLAD